MSERLQAIGAVVCTVLMVTSLFAGTVTAVGGVPTDDSHPISPVGDLSKYVSTDASELQAMNNDELSPTREEVTVASGSGTEADPYVITNASELQAMNDDLDASYVLGNDIDASSIANFDPIGEFQNEFTGSFDGDGYTISGLTINRPEEERVGLFGRTGPETAPITNVTLADVDITGKQYVGGVVGYSNASIRNVEVSGTVSATGGDPAVERVGTAAVVGGAVGYVNDGSVDHVTVSATVTSDANQVGGVIGVATVSVSNLAASGDVTGNERTGGIVGEAVSVSNTTMSGDVTGNTYSGGIVGVSNGPVSNATMSGDMTTTFFGGRSGGIIGEGGPVSDSLMSGDMTGGQYGSFIGGAAGYADKSISNTTVTGNVTGYSAVGGVAGSLYGSTIATSIVNGNVTSDGSRVGGLAGVSGGSTANVISDSYVTGNVTGSDKVGGLVGENKAGIDGAYAVGNVTGETNVGGAVGLSDGGSATDVYWDTETTTQNSSAGGTGLTTAELKGADAEANTNLDFTADWRVVASPTAISYPYLQPNTQEPAPGVESVVPPFLGGNGTVADPYQIGNWSHLDSVRGFPNANFTLVTNLDEETADYDTYANETANGGAGWEPIGTAATPFSGSFDGDGHTIAGLRINRTTQEEAGLFGNATDVTIERVTLDNVNVSDGSNASGLVGYATDVRITDVTVNGNVTGDSVATFAGGAGILAGYTVNGTITNVAVNGNVLTDGAAGGVAGYVINGTVENASMNENPDGIATYEGVEANVLGRTAGGVVGSTVPQSDGSVFTSGSVIRNSTANATVAGQALVGGLAGVGETVTGSTADGAVSGQAYTGGLIGLALGDVTGSAATGDVQRISVESRGPADTHGGLIGATGGNVTDSRATGDVASSSDNVGGLVGTVGLSALGVSPTADLSVVNSTATGDVDGADSVGGLVGTVAEGNITGSTASGAVNATGIYAGGLVGEFITTGGIKTHFIANSSASGDVVAKAIAGGLVGANNGSVTVSYATGGVAADSDVGGLVGINAGAVNRTYAAGSVTGDNSGLVGTERGDGNSANSYWDTETTAQSSSAGDATGLTTSELKGASVKINTAFNFATTWSVVDNGTHISYPSLQANPQRPEPGLERIAVSGPIGGGSVPNDGDDDRPSRSDDDDDDPRSVVSVSSAPSPDGGQPDDSSAPAGGNDEDGGPGEATDRQAVSVRNVGTGERVAVALSPPGSDQSETDTEADDQSGGTDETTPRNVLPDGLDITFKQSGDYDFEVSSRDIDVFDRAMDDSETDARPDLSTDALDDESKRFVSETNQRPVGFIGVDTAFDSDEAIQEATHRFRVRKSYLTATGASVESVTLYRDETDGWRSLPTRQTREDEEFHYFEADTPGFSMFAIGTSSPVFETGAASLDSFDDSSGELEASVSIENVGDEAGTFDVTLAAEGTTLETTTVTLASGETVTANVSGVITGPATVTLAGQSLGELSPGATEDKNETANQLTTTADEPTITTTTDASDAPTVTTTTTTTDAPDADSNDDLTVVVVMLLLLFGLLFIFLWRRRDDHKEE